MSCPRSSPRAGNYESDLIYRPKSFSLNVVNWFHVAGLYVPYLLTASLVFAIACLLPPVDLPNLPTPPTTMYQAVEAVTAARDEAIEVLTAARGVSYSAMADSLFSGVRYLWAQVLTAGQHITGLWYAYAIIAFWIYWQLSARPPVYILDFAVYEAPKEWQVSRDDLVEIWRRHGCYSEESLAFMAKLLANSGTGDKTHWPPGTIKLLRPDLVQPVSSIPPVTAPMVPEAGKADTSLAAARAVAENILCNCFEQVLVRTGIKARDVDFLIVNCSLFCPTPSLCAIIATRFSLKATTRTYNLGGMGCSASLISIDLAKQLLQNNPNSIAVVLSTEEITQNMYLGAEKSMLLQNTLFRVGGAGIALSNKPIDGFRAKYKLLHTVRVQDNSEVGHRVVFQTEDSAGNSGCQLGKEITKVAGKALVTNFTILGPRVLPIREQLTVVMSLAHRWIIKQANRYADAYGIKALPFSRFDGLPESPELDGSASPDSKVAASAQRPGRYRLPATYVPDFKRAVQHFCIHAGGRAVIDGIEQNLSLDRWQTAPSRATLYHWGNTSSSSVWYELRYCEGVNDRGGAVPPPKREASGAARASSPASGQASMGSPGKNAPNPDAEAAANGWDTNDKWSLPEYRGRTVRTGDRIVQIAFGAGFKCNSAVLLALRDSGDKR